MEKVYIVDAVRTPVGKYGGALSTIRPDDLLAHDAQVLLPVCCKLVCRKLAYFLAVIADASIVFFSQSIHKMDERSFSASRGRHNLNPLARMKSHLLSPNI